MEPDPCGTAGPGGHAPGCVRPGPVWRSFCTPLGFVPQMSGFIPRCAETSFRIFLRFSRFPPGSSSFALDFWHNTGDLIAFHP